MSMREEYEWAKAESDDSFSEVVDGSLLSSVPALFYGVIEKASEPVSVTLSNAKEAGRNAYLGYLTEEEISGLHGDWRSPAEKTVGAVKAAGHTLGSLVCTAGLQVFTSPITAILRMEQMIDVGYNLKDKVSNLISPQKTHNYI